MSWALFFATTSCSFGGLMGVWHSLNRKTSIAPRFASAFSPSDTLTCYKGICCERRKVAPRISVEVYLKKGCPNGSLLSASTAIEISLHSFSSHLTPPCLFLLKSTTSHKVVLVFELSTCHPVLLFFCSVSLMVLM
jgi:hypothetical protein